MASDARARSHGREELTCFGKLASIEVATEFVFTLDEFLFRPYKPSVPSGVTAGE